VVVYYVAGWLARRGQEGGELLGVACCFMSSWLRANIIISLCNEKARKNEHIFDIIINSQS
jgi:hypothetical protein